jgi:hypothetical protein
MTEYDVPTARRLALALAEEAASVKPSPGGLEAIQTPYHPRDARTYPLPVDLQRSRRGTGHGGSRHYDRRTRPGR